MFTFDYLHSTPTTNIAITLKATFIDPELLKSYEDKFGFEKLCSDGCPNYNKKWSCPPFTPSYTAISENYKNALLVLQYCNLSQFNYTTTEYMKVKASNSILKSKSDKLMKFLEKEYSGTMLSNGSCRLCNPCNKKKNLNCKKPNEIRYSMEALGLDVGSIAVKCFNHKLLWYANKLAPKYSSVVTCLLTNSPISTDEISFVISNYYQKDSVTNFVYTPEWS